ncbi:putative non-specific serine/threonine protein kinase [Helianthus annuus]|nr:putative non-specific serine/threonine protein kinase [Helianthus annuus]
MINLDCDSGYMAPEYAMEGLFSTKSDVYSFGQRRITVDHRVIQTLAIDKVLRWINIALLCVQEDPQDRPTMSSVVFMLEGQWSANLPTPSEPPLSFARFASIFEQTKTTSDQSTHISVTSTSSTTASR